jgi:hypothetical protein
MNETFDVAGIAAGRVHDPSEEPDGIGTPEGGQHVTRAGRLASQTDSGPRRPEFAVDETEPQAGDVPTRVHGPSEEAPEGYLPSPLDEVPFAAYDQEDRGPSQIDEGYAGGPREESPRQRPSHD